MHAERRRGVWTVGGDGARFPGGSERWSRAVGALRLSENVTRVDLHIYLGTYSLESMHAAVMG